MIYIPIPTTYFSALNRFVPESAQNHAVIPGHSILMQETQAMDPHNGHQMSQDAEKSKQPVVGLEPGPQELKVNALLHRCKCWVLPQGSRSALYIPFPNTKAYIFSSAKNSK